MTQTSRKRERDDDDESRKKPKVEQGERSAREQDWNRAVAQLQESTRTLLRYGLKAETKARISEVAADAISDGEDKGSTGAELIAAAKDDLIGLLDRRIKTSLGKLGGMTIYKVWGARSNNGKTQWLFYPPEEDATQEVHITWLPNPSKNHPPVHVRIDRGDQSVTRDYTANLQYTPFRREGQGAIPGATQTADDCVSEWRAEMGYQEELRRALAWLRGE